MSTDSNPAEKNLNGEQETVTTPEDDYMPVLIPDDYDPDEIDYSANNNLSDVVSAKDGIEEVERYKRPKLKGKEAVDNFFYHHKTTVIVVVVAVVLLTIAIIQSIPTKYDYSFGIYANVNMGMTSHEEIEDQLLPYAEDIDGNGEKRISVVSYNRDSTIDPYQSMVAYMFLDTEFGGEYNNFLVCVDKSNYDFLIEQIGADTFEAYKDYPVLISLKDSELITSVSESNNNHVELFLALISVPENQMDDPEVVARHDNAVALLERILEANPELGRTAEEAQ